MKILDMPPFAPVLMESTRAMGYSLESAIADIIDNSIAANASNLKDIQAVVKARGWTLKELEQVRAVLAEKSRAGYTADVRELLQKYGASKLSQVDPANYEALLSDAEVIGNAT